MMMITMMTTMKELLIGNVRNTMQQTNKCNSEGIIRIFTSSSAFADFTCCRKRQKMQYRWQALFHNNEAMS